MYVFTPSLVCTAKHERNNDFKMKANGVGADGIETTPNEVYGVSTALTALRPHPMRCMESALY